MRFIPGELFELLLYVALPIFLPGKLKIAAGRNVTVYHQPGVVDRDFEGALSASCLRFPCQRQRVWASSHSIEFYS